MLRAIKEERLKHFLGNLTKLCDWRSLSEDNQQLYDRLLKANTLRNGIMHGSVRLYRTETIDASNTLLEVIDWLRGNPFGYSIPKFPLLTLAEGEFFIVDIPDDQTDAHPGSNPPGA
jgi:hypothetical protein